VLPFIIAGLTAGAVYGLAGVGLVLTYKTSGVFNFAHGALATVSAYAFYYMHVQHHMPWPIAAAVCLVVIAPIVGMLFERLAKALAGGSLAMQVTSTVGVLLIVQAAFTIIYGTQQERQVPAFLPTHVYRIFGASVTEEKIIIFAVSVAATLGLWLFFRYARLGTAMRAVVSNPDLLDLAGTSPTATRRWAWIIGVVFAAASGLLLASSVSLTGTTLTLLIVQAFGAAAIGAFSSLPLTFLGGLGIGLVASLATKYFTHGVLSGVPASLPFIVLFVVLLVFPRRRLAGQSHIVPRSRPAWVTPAPVQFVGGLALLVVLAFVPSFAGIHLTDWTVGLTSVILFLSLGLLVRTSGQVSLCHISFAAIGAAAFSHFAVDHHWPWLLGLLAAGLIAVPISALLAIPAIRLTGLYLALATFGFGVLLTQMFYTSKWMFGELGLGLSEPRPKLSFIDLQGDKNFYYLVLGITVLVTLVVVALNRSRLGRLLRGMADSPVALATNGASVNVTRVLVFCISGFIAAIAGALGGMAVTTATADSYLPLTSLTYLALVMITTGSEPWYAMQAGLGLTVIPSYLTNANTSNYLQLLFGVCAVLYALTPDSARGVPRWVRRVLDAAFRRRSAATAAEPAPVGVGAATDDHPASARVPSGALAALDLHVRFGGLIALGGVTIEAPTGKITGLIGPNGAGKTTTFNACSGLVRPSAGRILLNGRDVSRRGPATRARRGIGRTFQRMELFDSLTVGQNVALGAEAYRASSNPLAHLASSRASSRHTDDATNRALELCDLTRIAQNIVGSLSTGQRRLVELARCMAGPYRILLLDEPSSGLDRAETARFGEILTDVVRQRDVGILLVEHDMALVSDVCDQVYVLDFGQLIFSGTPAEVAASPVVQAAYLGDVELNREVPLTEEVGR
jgi:ABC-type branched-subunit amino acid transport system ATPase component/branched-subunit amino acid ABC-type transport system permease component